MGGAWVISTKGRDFTSETKQRMLGKEPRLLGSGGGGGEERVGARRGVGGDRTRLTSGASTGGCGQGWALCRRPGRGAGVLEDEARGAVWRGARNPMWGTRRGGRFLGRRARRAVRLKKVPLSLGMEVLVSRRQLWAQVLWAGIDRLAWS